MGEAAQLITAVAALVTAVGSTVAGILLAFSSLSRQRAAAAQEATRLTRGHRGVGEQVIDASRDDEPSPRHRHRAPRGTSSDIEGLVERAREAARDAQELALEAGRESRFERLDADLNATDLRDTGFGGDNAEPPPGGGGDA